jgi:succinate dehydrogenase / fumarate reductase flavoprotein subunit
VIALEMETGEVHDPASPRATLLATGGAGRIYAASTNAFINTGDGLGMAARAGIPLRGHGVLAVPPDRRGRRRRADHRGRARRGRLSCSTRNGERFMERYAPTLKDLASRDVVSRAMDQSRSTKAAAAARTRTTSCSSSTTSAPKVIDQRLPGISRDRHQFRRRRPDQGPDPGGADHATTMMGGIPTNINGQVVAPRTAPRQTSVVPGL